jgi:hypothetical protein
MARATSACVKVAGRRDMVASSRNTAEVPALTERNTGSRAGRDLIDAAEANAEPERDKQSHKGTIDALSQKSEPLETTVPDMLTAGPAF